MISRRMFLGAGVATGISTVAACAPAASPSAPGGTAAQPASTGAAWEQEWNDLVAAAKKEGRLALVTTIGAKLREGVEAFEKAFPGISIDHTSLIASNFAPKALQEFQAGVYNYDVITTTYGTVPLTMIPAGAIEPIKPFIFRQDVMDDKAWREGFADGWLDLDKKWGYAAFQVFTKHFWINTDMVKEGEIKNLNDVLNPKWKGLITGGDPRTHGGGWWPATIMRMNLKDDTIVKRLWKDQEVVLSRDQRQMTEGLIKGRYSIGIGAVSKTQLPEFLDQGLGKNLKNIEIPEADHLNAGSNVVYRFKNAPHPNTAKLFINWLLTKEGQTIWCSAGETNSRRTDVPIYDPEQSVPTSRKYIQIDRQELEPEWTKTQDLAKQVLN